MKVVIVTGLSGAGKTKAADWFEDKGYYVVDNMPPALIKNFIEISSLGEKKIDEAAFVVDIRGGEFLEDLESTIKNIDCKIIFLEASDETLIRRYNETRRHHPLTLSATTKEVIDEERKKLKALRDHADYIIDTSKLKTSDLMIEMDRLFTENKDQKFTVNVLSFGYKYGIPIESDWVLDMRFIPNPFYVPSLKKLTGNNQKVSQYVLKHDISKQFIENTMDTIRQIIPCYMHEGKYSLTIAFGCTGGHHRSVAMANEMARILEEEGYRVTLEHRDL
ncbi:MAG: RNase adapter RapZ [Clostridia bacterium]|nr:RNase adapter RapZ [Clostridia bacterium]